MIEEELLAEIEAATVDDLDAECQSALRIIHPRSGSSLKSESGITLARLMNLQLIYRWSDGRGIGRSREMFKLTPRGKAWQKILRGRAADELKTVKKAKQAISALSDEQRRELMWELLEAEALMHVDRSEDFGDVCFRDANWRGSTLLKDGTFCLPGYGTGQVEAESIMWGLVAALAEKRRREGE